MKLLFGLTLTLLFAPTPFDAADATPTSTPPAQTHWWGNDDIRAWIQAFEDGAALAKELGDLNCHNTLTFAAWGLTYTLGWGRRQGVRWRSMPGLNGLTNIWTRGGEVTRAIIYIDPASDDVVRTTIHEALHVAWVYAPEHMVFGEAAKCRHHVAL